jgi:hypothetical protein
MAKDINDNLGFLGKMLNGVGKLADDVIGFFIMLILGMAVIPVISLIAWGAYLLVKLLTY